MYPKFTKEMKYTHTILVPDMLPIHIELFKNVLEKSGYKIECLRNSSRKVVDEGLKNVHNDACYPALLVVGQFIDAMKSGKYDPNKVAFIMTQTGGGCRASNYINLIRKAISNVYPNIPVISLNFSGLEKDPTSGFKLTKIDMLNMMLSVFYGDVLMSLYNQVLPYEVNKGEAKELLNKWILKLKDILLKNKYYHLYK